jgi:tetratricopeptide (TPR) repeat protein
MEAVDLGAENDDRMARLREALVLGEGFQLVVVQVEPGELREEVLRRLAGWSERNTVPRLELMRLAPGESPVMRLVGSHEGVILVGLEGNPDGKHDVPRELITELNWSRDRLPVLVRGPLVLVVSQRVQTALFEQAPDFYSWRAHITSIAPVQQWPRQGFRWFDEDPSDPAALEAMIAAATLLRPPVILELARLHERLARAWAIRGEFPAADSAFDAARDGYARAGTTDDRVELSLLRGSVEIGRNRLDQAAAWLERARQDSASGMPSARAAARVASAGAILQVYHGDPSADAELERAVVVLEALGDDAELAKLTYFRAGLARRRGDPQGADRLLERARELYTHGRDPLGEAHMLMAQAIEAAAAGRSDDAERCGTESIARAEASGSVDMVARARATLGQIALANNHLDLAGEVLGHEVAAFDPAASGQLADARGRLALRRGDLTMAERFLRAALEAYQRRPAPWSVANISLVLGTLGRRTQNWQLARTGFEIADRTGNRRQRAVAALGLAEVAVDQGERSAALADRLAIARQMLVEVGDLTLADTARTRRAEVLLALDRDADARAEAQSALAGFENRGQAESAARARVVLTQLDRRAHAT